MRTASLLAALVLLGRVSFAEQTDIGETAMYEYDVVSLKPGDWVEYADASHPDGPTCRWACVGAEKNLVWIEISSSEPDSEVKLLGVSKASNLILFGYVGKAGEVGRPLKVMERHQMSWAAGGGKPVEGRKISPEEEREPIPAEQAKCTVSPAKEEISVGEQKFVCEKWTLEYSSQDVAKKKHVETWWVSERIPFRRRLDKAGNPMIHWRDVPWEGNRSLNGGNVKETHERVDGTRTTILKATGTDAKPTLKTKATDDGEKK